MAPRWEERERKLAVRAERKKQGGKFKSKESRDKAKGKQRKIYNQLRRILEDDEHVHNGLEGDDNVE